MAYVKTEKKQTEDSKVYNHFLKFFYSWAVRIDFIICSTRLLEDIILRNLSLEVSIRLTTKDSTTASIYQLEGIYFDMS